MIDMTQRHIDIKTHSDGFINFMALRKCVSKILIIFLLSTMFVSCSPYKRLAYDFVKKSQSATVAFYVPEELKKMNERRDCDPDNVDLVLLEEDQLRDTIEARTKIVNKIDDDIFLDVMYASFESALKDYDVVLEYHDEQMKADSLHWYVNLSHMEVQEYIEHLISHCGVEGNFEFFSSTAVNVASWFEMDDGDTTKVVFTEQNYGGYIEDCYYTLDSLKNLVVNVDMQNVSIEGFYDFAVILGKLYAGYCYDFFMNEYVRKALVRKGKEIDDNVYMRYDPYEKMVYFTRSDKMILMD